MSEFYENSKSNLASTPAEEAKVHLLQKGYFNDTTLIPKIIKPQHLDEVELDPIDWQNDRVPRTHLIKLISSKGDKGLRVHGLIHPKLYIHLVNEIVEPTVWSSIIGKLTADTAVTVYTLPQFTEDNISIQGSAWSHFDTIDYYANSLGYSITLHTDIQNFYGSIYTHSISWAMLGKEVAKNSRGYEEAANRIDKLMQNANDGQTNGIPIGNDVSNLLAELILKDVDQEISPIITQTGSVAMRYRDDYRFLCKTVADANQIYAALTTALNGYGLAINSKKTQSGSIFGENKSIETVHVSHQAFGRYWPYNEDSDETISGRQMFNAISALVDISKYQNNRNLLNHYASRILKPLSIGAVKLDDVDEWAEPTVGLLIGLHEHTTINISFIFALMDAVINAYKRSYPDNAKEIVIKIYNNYDTQKSVILGLWLYLLCLNVDEELATDFLNQQDSELFMMIKKQADESDITKYLTRDPVKEEDLLELTRFELIDLEVLSEIENSEESIAEYLSDIVFGGGWLSSHYD